MTYSPDPHSPRQPEPGAPRPDFEGHLARLQSELVALVRETDPTFDPEPLRQPPAVEPEPPVLPPDYEPLYPTHKEELRQDMTLSGPRLVEGDIYGDEVWLKHDIRVKGSVYGQRRVRIGPGCVIEGGILCEGLLEIGEGTRIEGAVIGQEIRLTGPAQVVGPLYSRESLSAQGRLTARALLAGARLELEGGDDDEARIEAGLIMAKGGAVRASLPLWLAGLPAQPDRHTFVVARQESGGLYLLPAGSAGQATAQPVILTVLTNTELEKLIAGIAAPPAPAGPDRDRPVTLKGQETG